MKKRLPQKTIFLSLVTTPTYSIRLTTNLRAQIDSGDPGLSFGCLTILLANIVIEIVAIFCENRPILRKFDHFLTPCDLKFDLIKKLSKYFCRTCHGLSNAAYGLSLSFLVFKFSGGGGGKGPLGALGHEQSEHSRVHPWCVYISAIKRAFVSSATGHRGSCTGSCLFILVSLKVCKYSLS